MPQSKQKYGSGKVGSDSAKLLNKAIGEEWASLGEIEKDKFQHVQENKSTSWTLLTLLRARPAGFSKSTLFTKATCEFP